MSTLQFLVSYGGSTATFNAYRRELERLLQWSWHIQQTSIQRPIGKPTIHLRPRFGPPLQVSMGLYSNQASQPYEQPVINTMVKRVHKSIIQFDTLLFRNQLPPIPSKAAQPTILKKGRLVYPPPKYARTWTQIQRPLDSSEWVKS